MVATAKRADAVWYPESDEMGEHELQRFLTELLRPLVERWLRAQGRVAHAGADQFFYWEEGNPKRCRAPDVYVIDGVPQDIPPVGVWKTWEGHVPAFALEVCGTDWAKDYDEVLGDYDAMGTHELILFDPGVTPRSRRRVRWQVFRRQGKALRKVSQSDAEHVRSRYLGCSLRAVIEREKVLLRLATGLHAQTIFPTGEEAAVAGELRERAAKEAADAARRAADAARDAALAEVQRLREELARRG